MALRPGEIGKVYGSVSELLQHAQTLEGYSAWDVADAIGDQLYNSKGEPDGKTGVGALVERFFGKKSDSLRQPDFPELGVEVKTLPMKTLGKSGWTIKEPTSITMIDYHVVDVEEWEHAYVRHKIAHILWVPYEHSYDDKRRSRFRRAFLWTPPPEDEGVMRADYERVQKYIREGRAHDLSESLSSVLAARRKGAKDSMKTQPHSPLAAKARAWAFKPAYTRPILSQYVLREQVVSLIEAVRTKDVLFPAEYALKAPPKVQSLRDVVPFIEYMLRGYEGRTLAELAASRGAKISGGKSGPAAFVRQMLGIKGKGQIIEFEKLGVRIQTVWAEPDSKFPWEAVSFPAMILREFAEEDWDSSQLQDLVDRILFIPLYSKTRKADNSRSLGRPFFWSPTPEEMGGIVEEWAEYQMDVKAGKAAYVRSVDEGGKPRTTTTGRPMRENRLKKMTDTEYIHIRPHGLTSEDVDIDPLGQETTKQCFWLNKEFLQRILKANA